MGTNFNKIIIAIFILIISTFINVFICFCVSSNVLLLLVSRGIGKELSLLISTISILITYSYIIFNYKIRQFLKERQ
jgi:hypothetical protein